MPCPYGRNRSNHSALFGGVFSSVTLAQLDLVHELRIPLMTLWASALAITRNGRVPNYVFRFARRSKV